MVKQQQNGHERIYEQDVKIFTDLYKLNQSQMLVNKSWHGGEPDSDDLVPMEHCHFYHTVNSDGHALTRSAPIGGHFHLMEVTQHEGKAPTVTCKSGPLKEFRKKIKGKYQKIFAPINNYDNHTHTVSYIKSLEIAKRQLNVEAQTLQGIEANKGAPVPGVLVK